MIEMLPKYPLLLQEYMLQPLYFLSLDAAEAVLIDSTRVSKRLYRLRFDFVAAAKKIRFPWLDYHFAVCLFDNIRSRLIKSSHCRDADASIGAA